MQRPANWPPFALHKIDGGVPEGWYSYQISGVDIFGRHSPNSPAAQWYQWVPIPDPRPWYYQDPPGHQAVHPFAVRLLDKIPPPPPAGIEACALDPADPYIVRDEAYNQWHTSLDAAEKDEIGLRIHWLWTPAHERQAPHTQEFRIYYQSGNANALPGMTTSITKVSDTECEVETDIPNKLPAGAYKGAYLNIGPYRFIITDSQAGSPLTVRVEIQQIHSTGTVNVEGGSTKVKAKSANLSKAQVGQTFQVDNEEATYTIL